MRKRVTVTHFTTKIICTYLYITCNKESLFVKKYQPISGGIGIKYQTHTHTHTHTIYTCTCTIVCARNTISPRMDNL